MIISHRHKFIFIRPRKIASTSISLALARSLGGSDVLLFAFPELRPLAGLDGDEFQPVRQQNGDAMGSLGAHALPRALRDQLGEDVWQRYLKFTVVRNPWDLFVSLHVHWMRRLWDENKVPGMRGILRLRSSTLYRNGRGFGQAQRLFLSGQLKESLELALRRGLYRRQLTDMEQFYFVDGRRYANCYLRFENLQADFDSLCERLGLEQRALPRQRRNYAKATTDTGTTIPPSPGSELRPTVAGCWTSSATASTEAFDQLVRATPSRCCRWYCWRTGHSVGPPWSYNIYRALGTQHYAHGRPPHRGNTEVAGRQAGFQHGEEQTDRHDERGRCNETSGRPSFGALCVDADSPLQHHGYHHEKEQRHEHSKLRRELKP